ncbi:hypothetical protein [Streptomyces sp. NPDC055085]
MRDDVTGLRPGEIEITDSDALVWRQVNPAFIHDGRVSSQAFVPTEKDAGELSVNQASLVSAEAAFDHYTRTLEFPSAGVYSLTVGEVAEVPLSVVDDNAVEDGETRPPGHAFVDFKPITSGKRAKKIAALLRDRSEARGWVYQPGSGEG